MHNVFARLLFYMQAAEQAEHHIGLANARVPPGWSVEQDRHYPLRAWVRDVELWAAATDVPEPRQAPAIVLRLTGLVRHILREVPVQPHKVRTTLMRLAISNIAQVLKSSSAYFSKGMERYPRRP